MLSASSIWHYKLLVNYVININLICLRKTFLWLNLSIYQNLNQKINSLLMFIKNKDWCVII